MIPRMTEPVVHDTKTERAMDARTYFLLLHEEAHFTGKARRIFELPTPDQWRAVLPGHNAIAWCVWHIASGEDWGIAALRGDEPLMTRDGWEARLGVTWPTFGVGMTAAEVADLSAAIDLDALREYYRAVYEETRRFVQGFDFDTLDTPLDQTVYHHALDLLGGDEFMRTTLESWTVVRDYLNTMALMDVYYHFDEADHMVRLLMPERRFP
jgi:DinB superfamily